MEKTRKIFAVLGMVFIASITILFIYGTSISEHHSKADEIRRALTLIIFLFCFLHMKRLYSED